MCKNAYNVYSYDSCNTFINGTSHMQINAAVSEVQQLTEIAIAKAITEIVKCINLENF